MDEIHEYQKLQSYGYGDHHYSIVAKSNNNYNKYQYLLRRTLQVVVSVTILSFFYCYSHGVSFFPHSFSVYFSTFLFSLFTRTLERKYMFLICNGILVFLAKTSVSSGDYISSCLDQTTINSAKTAAAATAVVVEEHRVLESNSADDVVFEEEETVQKQEADLEQVIKCADQDDNNEGGDLSLIMNTTTTTSTTSLFDEDYDENENANDDDGGSDYNLSKQEASNFDEELISTDELNKKIEEFIRKMKEEIRVEAQQQQQQLIAV